MADEKQEVAVAQPATPVKKQPRRAPRGFDKVKIDNVSRFKVPAKLAEYIGAVEDPHVFVTEFDEHVRIFINGSFEAFLDRIRQKSADLAKAVAKDCELRGADVDIDSSDRITIPQATRKVVALENQTVYLRAENDVVTVFTEAEYNRMSGESSSSAAQNASHVKQLGIEL